MGGWGGISSSTVMKFHYAVFGIGCTAAILSKHSTVCSSLLLNGTLHSMLTERLQRMQLIHPCTVASNVVDLLALGLMAVGHKCWFFSGFFYSECLNNYWFFSFFLRFTSFSGCCFNGIHQNKGLWDTLIVSFHFIQVQLSSSEHHGFMVTLKCNDLVANKTEIVP